MPNYNKTFCEEKQEVYNELKQEQERLLVERKQQSKLKATQETLIDITGDMYASLPNSLQAKIKSNQSIENLRALTRKVYKTESLEEFTELIKQAADE